MRVLFFLMASIIEISCHQGELTPRGFANYCKDTHHGLIKTSSSGSYSFVLSYKPPQLMALQEIGKAQPKIALYDSILKDFNSSEYFVLRVSADSTQTEKKLKKQYLALKYDSVMNYIRFSMQNDFYLTSGTDTLSCAIYELENSGGIDPALNFSMAFDKPIHKQEITGDLVFHFQDKVFQRVPLVFRINNKDIKSIPPLQLD